MSENINTFQDLLIEEFEIEDSIKDDELNESMDMLDIVMTENDEKRVNFIESDVDSFINDIDLKMEQIVKEEREESMNELLEFFDVDAEILEESVDKTIEEIEDLEYDDEGDIIDTIEGLPEIDDNYVEED